MALGTGLCPGQVEKGVAMGMLPPGQGFIHRAVPGMKGALWQCPTVLHSFWLNSKLDVPKRINSPILL